MFISTGFAFGRGKGIYLLVSSDEAATFDNNGAPGWRFGNKADKYV